MRVFDTEKQMRDAAAWAILKAFQEERGVISLATGTTTAPIYAVMAALYAVAPIAFGGLRVCCLDEYVGLPQEHPGSCVQRLVEQALLPLGIDRANGIFPAAEGDPGMIAVDFEAAILARGGISLQVLGLGEDGHIGFCRPGTPFSSRAHAVLLPDDTRALLRGRYHVAEAALPTHGVTLGIQSVLHAEEILVAANGRRKAEAVRAALEGPITEAVPASCLQMHPRVTWLLDAQAASLLARGEE